MKTIGVAEFNEQCLALIDEVDDVGLIITKDGSPVARITRFEGGDTSEMIGCLAAQN